MPIFWLSISAVRLLADLFPLLLFCLRVYFLSAHEFVADRASAVPRILVSLRDRVKGQRIQETQLNDHIWKVRLGSWTENYLHPFGHLVDCLGERGDREVRF